MLMRDGMVLTSTWAARSPITAACYPAAICIKTVCGLKRQGTGFSRFCFLLFITVILGMYSCFRRFNALATLNLKSMPAI